MGKALGFRRYGFSSQLYHSFPVGLLGLRKKKAQKLMTPAGFVPHCMISVCFGSQLLLINFIPFLSFFACFAWSLTLAPWGKGCSSAA